MDYRNGDGSTAEMCGNGARVFSKVLLDRGLVPAEPFTIATRGGPRAVRATTEGFAVDMGAPHLASDATTVDVAVGALHVNAVPIWFPNPHAVAFVDSLSALGAMLPQPTVNPGEVFPEGANFEFAVVRGENHVEFRVHERGAGETASCGTGACAVAWAYRQLADAAGVPSGPITVDVPGGRLTVSPLPEGRLELAGPVVIVAEGSINKGWWGVSYE
jgi:diaminopimelate epimerase